MPLSITYEAPANMPASATYFARIRRTDTKQYLDPSDPTGRKWTDDRGESGWPLPPVATEPDQFEAIIPTPVAGWPDELDVVVAIYATGQDKRLRWDTVRNYHTPADGGWLGLSGGR
jgi:hypothetical protein